MTTGTTPQALRMASLVLWSWDSAFSRGKMCIRDREELQLIVNGQPHDWSLLFHRSTDKAVLSGGSVTIDGKTHPACSVTLRYDRIEIENGDVFLLERLESVE